MKLLSRFLLPLLLPVISFAAAAPENPVDSTLTEVTVYADRAQVTRVATLTLPAGTSRHTLTNLPGWLDEGSVRVNLQSPEVGRILDVQIHRTYLAKPSSEEFRAANTAVQEINDQIAALDDEKAVLDAQAKYVESMRVFSLEKLPKDAATRAIEPEEYTQTLEFITTSLRKTAIARRDLDKKRRELEPELNVRRKRLEELNSRAQLEQQSIIVTTDCPAEKQTTLSVDYMLPGATWTPVHELRTTDDGESVTLSSYAVVMQTSGEDWTDVKLSLSTQNSSKTMKIPELESLLVGAGRNIAKVKRSSSSFGVANQKYLNQNGAWNFLNNPAEAQREYGSNTTLLLDNAERVSRVFATLEERGTTAHFHAEGRQTIRTDGRQVRVPLGTQNLTASQQILAAPELSLNAAHTVDLTNVGTQSILPGKVSLYQAGAFLGLTESEFVAPGESFALYLGVADEIKLSRVLDKKRSELKRGSRKTKMEVSFLVTVENLSNEARTLQLTDRVPISQDDDARVYSISSDPSVRPDNDGLLTWDVTLAAKQTQQFRIEYKLEYPTELPQRDDAQQAAPVQQFQHQIKSLEKRF